MSSGISFYFETFASERFNQTPCKLMARKALKWNVAKKLSRIHFSPFCHMTSEVASPADEKENRSRKKNLRSFLKQQKKFTCEARRITYPVSRTSANRSVHVWELLFLAFLVSLLWSRFFLLSVPKYNQKEKIWKMRKWNSFTIRQSIRFSLLLYSNLSSMSLAWHSRARSSCMPEWICGAMVDWRSKETLNFLCSMHENPLFRNVNEPPHCQSREKENSQRRRRRKNGKLLFWQKTEKAGLL